MLCTSLAPSSHGATSAAKILTASQELDDNGNRMDLTAILPKLAELLQLKTEQVETAMVERKIP